MSNQIKIKSYSKVWTVLSECILFLFVVVGYIEKIQSLYSLVMIFDCLLAIFSFFYIWIYFFIYKELRLNIISRALLFLVSSILISSIVRQSDSPRLVVALFALLELGAVFIALIILHDKYERILIPCFFYIIAFSLVYSLLSIFMGLENGESRIGGLSNQTNSLAVVASSSLLIALSLLGKRESLIKTVLFNSVFVASIPFFAFTFSKTDSRTSFFALLIALCFYFVFSILFSANKKGALITGLISLIVSIFIITLLLSSSRSMLNNSLSRLTSGRTDIWVNVLSRMDITDYLFGFGGNSSEMRRLLLERGASLSSLEIVTEKHLMHNIFIQFLVEYGAVAALSFLVSYVAIIVVSFSAMRKEEDKERKRIVLLSAVLLVFFFVHSLAESSIFFIGGSEQILFILSFAVIYSYYREKGSKE